MIKTEAVCPYCKSALAKHSDIVSCPDCKAFYHFECWAGYGRCCVFGCPGVEVISGNGERIDFVWFKRFDLFLTVSSLVAIIVLASADLREITYIAVPLWLFCVYLTLYFAWLIIYKDLMKKALNQFQRRRVLIYEAIIFIPTLIGVWHILNPRF